MIEENTSNIPLIRCPVCGYEYTPSEIYVPSKFFGNPNHVERMDDGRIDFFDGEGMDLNEEYVCDKCGTCFDIKATISFKTSSKLKKQFSEEHVTKRFPDRISLFEEE